MSVLVTLVASGDAKAMEQLAQSDPALMQSIIEAAKSHGLIAHRFYGSEGKLMVIDEWPDAASFQAFFAEQQSKIEPIMQQVVTSEPEITVWTKLETGDDVGWA